MNLAGWLMSVAPLAAAAAMLLSRHSSTPPAQADGEPARKTVELPIPAREASWLAGDYDLVAADSAVVVTTPHDTAPVRARTSAIDATLRSGPNAPETLILGFELLSLQPAKTDPGEARDFLEPLRSVFGVAIHDDVRLVLRCTDAASVPGLPLRRSQWTGTLNLDRASETVRLELWQGSWSDDRFRIQGVVALSASRLGLTVPYALGLWPGDSSISIGLDLSFRLRK